MIINNVFKQKKINVKGMIIKTSAVNALMDIFYLKGNVFSLLETV